MRVFNKNKMILATKNINYQDYVAKLEGEINSLKNQIVILNEGDRIPADGILVDSLNLSNSLIISQK